MSITFPYRSDLGPQGSIEHPRHRSNQLQVPPELTDALGGGPIAATRALRELLNTNGIPLSVGAGDAELARRAQQQQWPDQAQDQILKLCTMLLEAVLQQPGAFQQRAQGPGAEPSARQRAHAFDGERLSRRIARKVPEPSTSTPAQTPTPPRQTGTSGEDRGSTEAKANNGLRQGSVPYDQLPARMKGGISPDNGMPTIILRDEKDIDRLPMWDGMHPDAAKSYRQRLADALQTEGGSVMGFAGYEVEVVGTKGAERSRTPAKPYVSDAQIREYVNANLNDPGKIAEAMKEHGISIDRVQAATGHSRKEVVDFVMATSNKALIDLL